MYQRELLLCKRIMIIIILTIPYRIVLYLVCRWGS